MVDNEAEISAQFANAFSSELAAVRLEMVDEILAVDFTAEEIMNYEREVGEYFEAVPEFQAVEVAAQLAIQTDSAVSTRTRKT